MKIRKDCLILGLGAVLAFLSSDQPRRQVPTFWQTCLTGRQAGLTREGEDRFVIQVDGDITLKYVTARLGAGNMELIPVPFYQDQGLQRQSVKEIARRFSLETRRAVVAAVNGGFFDTATGLPIGFLLRDGQMDFFKMPQGFHRSMVGFSAPWCPRGATRDRPAGRQVWINSPQEMPKAWLDTLIAGSARPLRTATVAVHQINVPGGRNALSLFTPTYNIRLRLPEEALYAIAQPEPGRPGIYRVSEVESHGSVSIPLHGLVVAMHGNARREAGRLPKGTLIRPRWSLPADWTDHAVTNGLLAGPRLLEDGNIHVTAKAERLDTLRSRDRMALAVKSNGEAILVWAHKNTPGNLSFEDVAQVLSKMGAEDAIALDGGRSHAILAQSGGALADERYYEGGRPVANALVLAVKSPSRS
jgi:exopolysaccharide biosynthesis protein